MIKGMKKSNPECYQKKLRLVTTPTQNYISRCVIQPTFRATLGEEFFILKRGGHNRNHQILNGMEKWRGNDYYCISPNNE